MRIGRLEEETYVCLDCGFKFTVQRPMNKRREKGHFKWLYCLNCKKKKDLIDQRYLYEYTRQRIF